jgi:hypothetical protein
MSLVAPADRRRIHLKRAGAGSSPTHVLGSRVECCSQSGTNVRATSKSRNGHCRYTGRCAMLRTIERCRAQRAVAVLDTRVRFVKMANRYYAISRARETQKARKDAMPHERGLKPVPPSEFFNPALADSQSSLLSLARQSLFAGHPGTQPSRLNHWRHGTCFSRFPRPSSLARSQRETRSCAHQKKSFKNAPPGSASISRSSAPAEKTRNEQCSASSLHLQGHFTGIDRLLDFDGRDAFELLPDGLGLVLGRVLL